MTALKEQWQQAREQRQVELQQRREQLVQQLTQLTAQRREKAIATATDLQHYIANLQANVTSTRLQNQQALADLQAEVVAMAADVQASLIEIRQDRQTWSVEMMEQLATEADALRQTVHQFLTETADIRQEQAAALQIQLKSDRQAQIEDVAVFRESLKTSLAALKVFRQQLKASVWGVSSASVVVDTALAASQATPSIPHPEAPAPKPQATPTEVAKANALEALKTPLTNTEQTILDYLKDTDGLKVIDIEQALLLQRLQTIDALRTLQQRGLVIQKERRYYAA
ncbi:MAG: gas vesicle protein GvpC [Cyanobacteria bacterium J06632_22]